MIAEDSSNISVLARGASRGIHDHIPRLAPRVHEQATRVSRFESDLLRILRFLLGHVPVDVIKRTLETPQPSQPGLSPNANQIVQQHLSVGMVQFLVRGGAGRDESFLRDGQAMPGRVWDRLQLHERTLQFSPLPLQFLMWLTSENPAQARSAWSGDARTATLADQLFFLLAQQQLRQLPELWTIIRRAGVFQDNGFIRLADPATCDGPPPDFALLFVHPGPAVLESLQHWLTTRWIRLDRAKRTTTDWNILRTAGEAEAASLTAFLAMAETHRRLDLARFVLRAAANSLAGTPDIKSWTGGLAGERPPRLADRIATRKAALALPVQMLTLARWDDAARRVRHFDDDYTAAQWWKAEYEAYDGRTHTATAERLLRSIDPLTRPPE